MSQANVDAVKRLFECYLRGDYGERLFDVDAAGAAGLDQ